MTITNSPDWETNIIPEPTNLTAFGTFVCGGGSSLGYKLAGFNHLGGVEIDPKMAKLYKENLNPKYLYLEDIRAFNQRDDLPEELYNLDLLDGSPPCTTFSMAGKREKGWGVKKKFAEGGKAQRLDDLVFVYCETIIKLKPKVAILENVPGIMAGKAKKYVLEINRMLTQSGYDVQIFLLNSATMGVPQARERVFFIARRKDLNFKALSLSFNEPLKPFSAIVDKGSKSATPKQLWPSIQARIPYIKYGDQNLKFADARYRGLKTCNSFFSTTIHYDNQVPGTLTSQGMSIYYYERRALNDVEYRRMSSFPSDYNFMGVDARYVLGMSVPPLMTARIAAEIRKQWFND